MLRSIKEARLLPLALAITAGLGAGWWAHGGTAHAAPAATPAQYQLSGNGNALSLYYPSEHVIYVYPAQSGADNIYCAYSIHIGTEGGAIQRENCAPGKLFNPL